MPQPCSVCTNPDHQAIDAGLAAGTSCRAIARRHGLDPTSVSRHNRAHRLTAIATAAPGAELVALQTPQQDDKGRFLPGNSIGRQFIGLSEAVREQRKNDFVGAIYSGATIREALEVSGMATGHLYTWAKEDERLQEALEYNDNRRRVELVSELDDIVSHPEKYDDALKRPAWANLRMFRTKALLPEYRDNFQVNVNVDARTAVGDWQAAVQAAREAVG